MTARVVMGAPIVRRVSVCRENEKADNIPQDNDNIK